MAWMTGKPGKDPPIPPHVDAVDLAGMLADTKSSGRQLSPLEQYLDANAPVPPIDRWGMPLPLSKTDQDRLDRMSAILWNPVHRGRALLTSGSLDTGEVTALRTACPEAYDQLRYQAEQEMLQAGPPLPVWSDGVLGVLFGRPVGTVYSDATKDKPAPQGNPSNYPGKPPAPTPADKSSDPALRG
jgi:hypothetical protein